KLFKLLRETRITESDPGAGQLLFAKMASKAANENLTDFFELWGFFIPVNNVTIEQYGTWKYNVTQTMINEAKSYMAQFPKAKHAFYYLEDRKNGDVGIENYKVGDVGHYTQFKNNQTITKTVGYTRSGQRITISGGDESVAFEIKRGAELLFFSNFLSFEVPSQISLDVIQVYAVQADGKRVQAILK
ncbi:MAG: carbohydrate-binding protein, partial [Bacteroides sp.]